MKKLVIKVVGVIFLITFLIYLFYSPRLKFDVLENPNKGSKTNRTEQFKQTDKDVENPKPKPVKCPIAVNIIKNDAPITTSDETMSTLFKVNNVTLNFLFRK